MLDNLWIENYNDWDELATPLINGKIESRDAHTLPIHKVEMLSDDNC